MTYPFGSQHRVFSTFDKNFYFKIRRENQKNSYERRAYESVDVRSLFLFIPHRSTETSTPGLKGLNKEIVISPHLQVTSNKLCMQSAATNV